MAAHCRGGRLPCGPASAPILVCDVPARLLRSDFPRLRVRLWRPCEDATVASLTGHFVKSAGRAATVAALIAVAAVTGVTSARVATAGLAAAVMSTTVPGAPNCPMFPANNVWNTNISKLPVDSHSAAWLRSMDSASTYLHPDFGPNTGGYPYGIPFTVVTSKHETVRIKFEYASESYRGKYPFGPDTPIEGGKRASGDRHAIMVNSTTCTLYELWDARYSPRGSTAGSGAMWNLSSNALRPAGWTSADAAGLPILPGLLNYARSREQWRPDSRSRTPSGSRPLTPARHTCGPPGTRPAGARCRGSRRWAPGSG